MKRFFTTSTLLLGGLAILQPWQASAQRALGVDVSSYQGSGVNWTSVKSSGRSFAWAKATEGTTITDADFTVNMNNAKAAGVYIGGYHFAHPNQATPAAEAGHFWSVAGPYIKADGKSFMPMLDMEVFSGLDGASSYSDWANQWCETVVSDAGGGGVSIRPFIYVSACNAGNFNSSVNQWLSDIADYNGESSQTGTPWSTCAGDDAWGSGVWTAWQYTDSGSVPGISGGVDSDVFNAASAAGALATSTGVVFGDFDGDGLTDYVLFRPSTATWYIRGSVTGNVTSYPFGDAGDIPLIGSWTTAARANFALFRPSTGFWYVRQLDGTVNSFQWGQNGDIPLVGAFSGQMRDQIAFRPSNGTWYIRFGNTGATVDVPFGDSGDIPLIGNFYGNGMVDQTLFRPSTGEWYARNGVTGSVNSFSWGINGDIPLIGAWSGQMHDACMFRPSNGTWYIRNGFTAAIVEFQFGQSGDQPMIGNIFGHGMVDQILYRGSTGIWYVRNGQTGTIYTFGFGDNGDKVVAE